MSLAHADYLRVRHFRTVDGLRAVSILLVFTAHPVDRDVWGWVHGPSGVTLFFVLSGFLITTLLLREQDRYGRVDLGSFYIRRLFRIYPMYFAVLALYCVLIFGVGMQPERRSAFAANLPWYALFFPERAQFFDASGIEVPFNMSWSIGIEEKFYLVWPLLGFLVLGSAALRRWRVPILVSVAVAAIVLDFTTSWGIAVGPYAHIAFGSLAAVLLHDRRGYERLAVLGRPKVLAGVVAVALVMQFGTHEIVTEGSLYHAFGFVAALVLVGVVTTASSSVDWLGSRPMVYLGDLSYVLYLIHNFGLNAAEMVVPGHGLGLASSLLATAVGIGGSVVAAHFIHKWFENPLRERGKRLAKERRAVATLPVTQDH